MMRKILMILLTAVLTTAAAHGQEPAATTAQRPFPYPAIPDTLRTPVARMAYLLERYWSRFDFSDSTATNRLTAEQGFVDYLDVLQYADSALAARSCRALADSIALSPQRQHHFDQLIDHYLGSSASPMRNDRTYAHLLRALPVTPQRTFLLGELTRNQVGDVAADLTFVADGSQQPQRLHDVGSELTLLVFHDPDCEHCHEVLPHIAQSPVLQRCGGRLTVFYINIEATANAAVRRAYYLTELPSLYLLDAGKRVVVKDGTLAQVEAALSAPAER